jgi:hypothetical protein
LRAIALERGIIAAAPFTAEDTFRLLDKGLPMIVNMNETLRSRSASSSPGVRYRKKSGDHQALSESRNPGNAIAKQHQKEAPRPALPPDLQDIRMSPAVPTISSVRASSTDRILRQAQQELRHERRLKP